MMPLVSVVVATQNRRDVLARALASVDAQSFRDFEVVVVNDGSTDGTAKWLRTREPAVSVVDLPIPQGAAAARNRGVARSTGAIIAFLDDDDFWRPSYLQVQVNHLRAGCEADLSTTAHIEMDACERISRPDLRPLFLYSHPLVHFCAQCPIHTLSVVACRRALFERLGLFDESLSIVHDLDLYLRLLASGGRIIHHSAELVERSVPGGLVTRHRQWFTEEQMVLERHFAMNHFAVRDQRRVRAARALFFARLSLGKGDVTFGSARLAEACLTSPLDVARIAGLAFGRRSVAAFAHAHEAGE